MSARWPYVRSMDGWWRRDPFFVRYMAREATAVLVVAYAVVLLAVFLYHTWSWFRIMPKTMPLILPDGRRLSPALVTGAGLTAAAIVCASLVVAAMKVAA